MSTTKNATGAWPVDQTPPHADEGKAVMYTNPQSPERVADWIKGIGGGSAQGVFPRGQAGVKGVD
jgi:hypothetical protein